MCSSASDHCAFKTEDRSVVEVLEVVDPVSVDDERVGDGAELKQPQKLGVVSREPGNLQAEDRADLTQAHTADQLLVGLACVRAAARDTQVGVDGQDPRRLPAERRGLLGEPVLTLGRAEVLAHLPR